MFSVCSNQLQMSQMAANLGQLSTLWNTARAAGRSVRHRNLNSTSSVESDVISFETLSPSSEAIRNCLEEIGVTGDIGKNIKIQEVTSPYISPELLKASSRLSEQHISTQSFFENANGFSPKALAETSFGERKYNIQIPFSQLLRLQPQLVMQQTVRGFKTDRAKTFTGLGLEAEAILPSRRILKNSLKQVKNPEEKVGPERLQNLMSGQNVTSEVADRLQFSFHEGYKWGLKENQEKTKKKSYSRLKNFLLYGLTIWIIISLWQTLKPLFMGMGGVKLMSMNEGFEAVNPEDITITFSDVKGCDEAKQELEDVVEFLKNPDKFKSLGAKLPKGVLLVGPPGIGKTLLARAVAGEAVVPFFHVSGSEFDEMFVGTGAKRVRALFDAAKLRAPCVVFIDEIDTVGAKRTSSSLHPYANQTVNQLLTEMDGFSPNTGVIVLGATNRRGNLDSALLRPGRFDVEVRVLPPDLKGRTEILELYMAKIKISSEVSIEKIAKGTTGCTGADLENIVNQAALKAALDGEPLVTLQHLEFAMDKVFMGPEKKSKIPDDEVNLCTAYHEAGHTVVAILTKDAMPVRKVTIMPRGQSLGHTSMLPEKDDYNFTKSQLLAKLDVAMGGRVAEEIIYGADKVTTGAQSDFSVATNIATSMVKHYGMSERVGVRVFRDQQNEFGSVSINDVSPIMSEIIDSEIKKLLQDSYDRAKALLKAHQTELKALADALIEYETLDITDIKTIMNGKTLKRTVSTSKNSSSDKSNKDIDNKKVNSQGPSKDPNLSFLTVRKIQGK